MRFFNRLNQYLLYMGIPGLLLLSFLDSAVAPMAGGPDAGILLLAWHSPTLIYLIVLAASAGSTLGSLILYGIGQKGGEKALSRFSLERRNWVTRKMSQNGVWAVIVAILAPPPFPTKLFILAAGVFRMGKVRFAAAVLSGRLLRYSFVAYLGARFGDRAAKVMKVNYPTVSLVLIGGIVILLLIRSIRRLRKGAKQAIPAPTRE